MVIEREGCVGIIYRLGGYGPIWLARQMEARDSPHCGRILANLLPLVPGEGPSIITNSAAASAALVRIVLHVIRHLEDVS